MIHRILEIQEDGRYLSVERGALKISFHQQELGKIPLDDIAVLLVSAEGASFSKHALNRIAERGGITILCGDNYLPVSIVAPLTANYRTAGNINSQINVSLPLCKQLWQTLVKEKLLNQSLILKYFDKIKESEKLKYLASQVRSGDKENLEAQGARIYWPALMGKEFRRNHDLPGINGLLNYGYAVLRGITARAICSGGLHPSIGIHHRNQLNSFCLADDLMEPYRPIFDLAVKILQEKQLTDVTAETKQFLIKMVWLDLKLNKKTSPLVKILQYLVFSLVKSYQHKKNLLTLAPLSLNVNEIRNKCF